MHNSSGLKTKRIIAGIIGLTMLFAVLFSAFYISVEADHHCCGEDCPICACIRQCEDILHRLGCGISEKLFFIIHTFVVLLTAVLFINAVTGNTLVSVKVRLNN